MSNRARSSALPARWRVAIVHDWLTGMRGGEKVLEALCELFPYASVHTLVHVPRSVSPAIERHAPRQSALGRVPGAARLYRHLLPLFPLAVEQFDLDEADLVISTSHCAAKSAVAPGRARHLCYCFTPMRYAWDQFDAYFGWERLGPLTLMMRPVLGGLARWDRSTSGRPDRYVAISQYVAARIQRYYNRRSAVIPPPVDTEFFVPTGREPDPYALVVSALVPYKRIELAIEACRRLGVPLKIAGDGPELSHLQQVAAGAREVEFLGRVSDDGVRELYGSARAVLLPGEEDFGLVPVEAQACGRPVVALGRGGALETVVDGETGVLVDEPTADALIEGLRRADTIAWDAGRIRSHALRFSKTRFIEAMSGEIEAIMNAPDGHQRW
ncbi:MAG: mshA 6 [Acidobacteria bacterium]|nr:mshA 6 [Acidobacteriota bacterium]